MSEGSYTNTGIAFPPAHIIIHYLKVGWLNILDGLLVNEKIFGNLYYETFKLVIKVVIIFVIVRQENIAQFIIFIHSCMYVHAHDKASIELRKLYEKFKPL